ncbi:MAG: carbohydrate porin [Verrucomicrobia bacterium]|nr:carbohydrate porin [Verrucomicrobiota bacterium]
MRIVRIFFTLLIGLAAPLLQAEQPPILDPAFNPLLREKIAGDLFGYRPKVEENGISLFAQSVNDMLWNTVGGDSIGSACNGLLQFGAEIDLAKAVGLPGGRFKNSWFWLYGRNPSDYVGDVNSVSGISGLPSFRCYELWYEQNVQEDTISLRGGLLALDTEFCLPDTALLFLNGTFGMPALISQNLVNSGPQYPMATPGIRLAVRPVSWLTLRSALSQANPFSQSENLHNFNWNFGPSGGLLSMNEAEARWDSLLKDKKLPGSAKAGFWIQSGATPTATEEWSFGPPSSPTYCTGFYGIIDQMIYRAPGQEESPEKNPVTGKAAVDGKNIQSGDAPPRGLNSWGRIGFCPQSYNPLSIYADGGLVYTGLIPGRKEDKLGLAFCYGQVSSGYTATENNQGVPSPSFEAVAELTYSIRLAPAIALQPDIQYVMHPSGTGQYGNALVAGFRAIVDF